MQLLNSHCGVDRDPRGVVRLTICNAGSLNILDPPSSTMPARGLEGSGRTGRFACWLSPGKAKKA